MTYKRLRYLRFQFFFYAALQATLRLILLLSSWGLVSASPLDLARTFGLGLAYDAVAGFCYVLPLALTLFLLPARWLNRRRGRWLAGAATFLMNVFALLAAAAQFLFWQEFHANFNFIAVDYLVYTTEVLGNIWQSYNMGAILTVVLLAAAALTALQMKRLRRGIAPLFSRRRPLRAPAFLLAAVLPAALGCSLTDSRWRNFVSENNYNVELAGNGMYELLHSFFANELDYPSFYTTRESGTVMGELREALRAPNSWYLSGDGVARRVVNGGPLATLEVNVVMVVEESLGADFCGAFGAEKSWTPCLDALAAKSYRFANMYATGTRTVRGLEALTLSVPPTPGQSILRRPDCGGLGNLAAALGENGYVSDFWYGGYGYFDNMNEFFRSNGYEVHDRTDIPGEEIFSSTVWGVADEILFSQALKTIDARCARGEKFFELIMTTSNHRPYTFPEKRVDAPQGEREGACRYADWAVGDFLRRAAEKEWFRNTVFVIVADHQASSAGHTALPVHRYHIPCLIYAPGLIAPGECRRLISQMDLPPTLLGMLGVSYDSTFLGRDIARVPEGSERAFIGTYQSLGYIRGDRLVVLSPQRRADVYRIDDWEKSAYSHIDGGEALIGEAVTWYQGASYLYRSGLLKGAAAQRAVK